MCAPALNAIVIMTEQRAINQHERELNIQQRVSELIPAYVAHEPNVKFLQLEPEHWNLNTCMEDATCPG
jgi:hypothetical protein